jgi:hypothetical protein
MPTTHSHPWPDTVDLVAMVLFLTVVVVLPAVGYVFMVLDFRAYLRSLQRGLIHVGRYLSQVPEWARYETPAALKAFGLRLPCTEEDLKRAYRNRVKRLHPDHGGDKRRFLIVQAQFEEALVLLGGNSAAD